MQGSSCRMPSSRSNPNGPDLCCLEKTTATKIGLYRRKPAATKWMPRQQLGIRMTGLLTCRNQRTLPARNFSVRMIRAQRWRCISGCPCGSGSVWSECPQLPITGLSGSPVACHTLAIVSGSPNRQFWDGYNLVHDATESRSKSPSRGCRQPL